jgi:hypothetical protein
VVNEYFNSRVPVDSNVFGVVCDRKNVNDVPDLFLEIPCGYHDAPAEDNCHEALGKCLFVHLA